MDESASKMMHSRIFSTKIRRRQKDELRGRKRRFPPRKTMSYDQELIEMLIILRTSCLFLISVDGFQFH